MRITRSLNLTFPVITDQGEVWVHSTPISRDIYHSYFDLIAQTVAQIHARGLNFVAGPSIAAMMLRKIAETSGRLADTDTQLGVENGLIGEMKRLTNVAVPGPQGGWTTIPYVEAVRRELFDDAMQDAIEGGVVFFICLSLIHGWQRERLLAVLSISGLLSSGGIPSVWRAQVTSLNSTEFANSLPISTETENSGAMGSTS